MVALAELNHLGTRREAAKDMIVSSGLVRMGGMLIAISRLVRHDRVVGNRQNTVRLAVVLPYIFRLESSILILSRLPSRSSQTR